MAIDQRSSPISAATTMDIIDASAAVGKRRVGLNRTMSLISRGSENSRSLDDSSSHSSSSSSLWVKSCMKQPKKRAFLFSKKSSKSVSFDSDDEGVYTLGLHEYSDREYAACFVSADELERSMTKAVNIAERERERPPGEKGFLKRGLEKMIHPDHTFKYRQQAYAAVLRDGVYDPEDSDIDLYAKISHECLCEALWFAERDAEFAKKHYSAGSNKDDESSRHTRSIDIDIDAAEAANSEPSQRTRRTIPRSPARQRPAAARSRSPLKNQSAPEKVSTKTFGPPRRNKSAPIMKLVSSRPSPRSKPSINILSPGPRSANVPNLVSPLPGGRRPRPRPPQRNLSVPVRPVGLPSNPPAQKSRSGPPLRRRSDPQKHVPIPSTIPKPSSFFGTPPPPVTPSPRSRPSPRRSPVVVDSDKKALIKKEPVKNQPPPPATPPPRKSRASPQFAQQRQLRSARGKRVPRRTASCFQ